MEIILVLALEAKDEEHFFKRVFIVFKKYSKLQITLYLVKRYSSLSLKEIGKIFDMDYTAVSQAVRRFEDKIKKDNKIRMMVNSVLELLKN